MKYINNILTRAILYIAIVMVSSPLLISCNDDDNNAQLEEKIIVSQIDLQVTPELPLLLGTDTLIHFAVFPDNATNKNVVWKSLDTSIASVTANGLIKANALGKTSIIVQPEVGNATLSKIDIEVISEIIYPEKLEITNTTLELFETTTEQLNVIFTPQTVTYKSLKWSSENPQIATVSADGLVKGIAEGKTNITAQAIDGSNKKVTVEVSVVKAIAVEDFTIKQPDDLGVNEKYELNCTLTPANATLETITWESSASSVVSVENGVLTALASGTATITGTATATGKKVSVDVSVLDAKFVEDYSYMKQSTFTPQQSGTSQIKDGKLVVTYLANGNRCDLKRNTPGYLDLSTYPVFAVKLFGPGEGQVWCTLDFYSTTLGVGVGNTGNIQNKPFFEAKDGSRILYLEMNQEQFFNGPHKTEIFQLKIGTNNNSSYYEVYWIKSFKSVSDLKAYLISHGDIDGN